MACRIISVRREAQRVVISICKRYIVNPHRSSLQVDDERGRTFGTDEKRKRERKRDARNNVAIWFQIFFAKNIDPDVDNDVPVDNSNLLEASLGSALT